MTKRNPDWNLLRSFLAVYQEKSLSAAARTLRLSQPTLGRHIENLEASLEVPLFTRSQAGLIPTEAALELVPHAQAMSAAAASVLRTATGAKDQITGTVRIATSEVVGGEILPGMIKECADAYPDISIELALSSRSEDLLKREADMAIRMFRPTQSALIARKICDTPIAIYAHRDYLAKRGAPKALNDLDGHFLIGPDSNPVVIQHLNGAGFAANRGMFNYRTDNDLAQSALIRAGAGIGGMQIRLARKNPDLVQLFPEIQIPMELWLVMHEDLRSQSRVRALYQFTADYLSRNFASPL